ncbi:hypothetical protein Lesp02_63730 [Lentzea sp. NBRC 105346]|uniref:DUF6923 family protein n=1 Tax=Lentzea sp. NBRC 105346 TaxID=3032205 RepID=UPI0024A3DFED|nr:hypothetical protein [Lentzea sp. NBRC 105346]GLZ34186.1 hypothetical protein Lesp02_63730 [Lentzea sp. NBRC 105346]
MADLDYAVNALGYSPALGRLVALATRERDDWHMFPAHIVLLDKQGKATDMGAIRAPWYKFDDVSAGTVVGTLFYLRDSGKLHAVDIDPASPTYLTIVRTVRLEPGWLGSTVDDFAVNPVDGKLYGLSSAGFGPGKIVTIDPVSGAVTKVGAPEGLPGGSTYGAVVTDSAGNLYATNNGFLHRSRFYRVPLDGKYTPAEVSSAAPVGFVDGAGCLPAPMPPKSNVPIPPAQPVPPAPPKPAKPAQPPAPPQPAVPTPPPSTPPPSVAPQLVPPRPGAKRPEPRNVASASPEPTSMTKTRKWAIATIVLVLLGASGAAARSRR